MTNNKARAIAVLSVVCWSFALLTSAAAVDHDAQANAVGPGDVALGELDSDGDGVVDDFDNCTLVFNPDQRDTNGDCFGNICDADLNNDGVVNSVEPVAVNAVDLGLMRFWFFTSEPDADLNGDGVVNLIDLGIMRTLFFRPPGPGQCPQTPVFMGGAR